MEIDLGELGHDEIEAALLIEGGDLVLELEALENVDVGAEPADVVDQVSFEALRVFKKLHEVELGGVVELPAGLLTHMHVEGAALVLLRQVADGVTLGRKDAVETAQNREGEDDTAVLVWLVNAPELVGDRPHKIAETAHLTLTRLIPQTPMFTPESLSPGSCPRVPSHAQQQSSQEASEDSLSL